MSNSHAFEDVAVIIIADEQSIRTTSSGLFTPYTAVSWDFGYNSNNGTSAEFIVEFRTLEGDYYGSQPWFADRFGAYPTGDILFGSE
ncbi:hypothetical protein [Alteromonas sp. KUL49]|uniref:hypothetical protein n=1 Tax=Alteromonas sp. KUL49 TaxID=2480798 RepID=UPI00102EEF29|nr:hypothetical protein [Alteromonas sp. KUL49]TAP35529.1 hypothetical protein EYS00_18625 [Alteromonas sp. KUL49]GEA13410.1 hypothetical protein KUL49_37850 [Alteromonas sp. KUL49]